MTPEPIAPLTIREILGVVSRRRWAAGSAALIVIVALIGLASLARPMFEATARLTVNRAQQVAFERQPNADFVQEGLLNTQREMVRSQEVLQRALPATGLLQNPAYQGSEDPLNVLRSRLSATTIRSTWVIAVGLRDEDPQRAEQALTAILDAHRSVQAARAREQSEKDLSFLREQVTEVSTRLERARELERDYRTQNGILSTDPDRNHVAQRLGSLIERQLAFHEQVAASASLMSELDSAEAAHDAHARREALLGINRVSNATSSVPHATMVNVKRSELAELMAEEAVLGQRYLDKHPRMIEIRQRIAKTHEELDRSIALACTWLRTTHRELLQTQATQDRAVLQASEQLAVYRDHLTRLGRMGDDRRAAEEALVGLERRLAEREVSSGLERTEIVVSDPPRATALPRFGTSPAFLVIGLILASAAAVLAAVAADALDARIQGRAALAAYPGLRILGALPAIATADAALDQPAPPALIEALRTLRTALRFARGPDRRCQVVVVTSPGEGDGKSTLTGRLAQSLAAGGMRTLVVDADLRRPSLDGLDGAASGLGFAHLLAGDDAVAPQATHTENLDLLPAGGVPPNPTELLHSHCLPEWLATAREHYEVILFDTPPIEAGIDAVVLSAYADHIMVVVRDRHTERQGLARSIQELAPVADRVLGVVFNGERGGASGYPYYDQRVITSADEHNALTPRGSPS